MRRASRQPSSFKLPSMTIGTLARVIEYVSPLVDVCALAGVAVMTIAAATAVFKMHRPDISFLSGLNQSQITSEARRIDPRVKSGTRTLFNQRWQPRG